MTIWRGRSTYDMRVSSRTARYRAGGPWTDVWLHWDVRRIFGVGGKRWAIALLIFDPEPSETRTPTPKSSTPTPTEGG